MSIDEIKKEFIHFMESIHEGLLFPKNYFGCLMAVFVEQQPTTQERIEELTGYSRATISQMLKLIQMNFKLSRIKEPKKRKKFYCFNESPEVFMQSYLEMVVDTYTKDKIEFILPLIEEVEQYTHKHIRFKNFRSFLVKSHSSSFAYIELFRETRDILHSLIKDGQMDQSFAKDKALLEQPDNKKIIEDLLQSPPILGAKSSQKKISSELSKIYDELKNLFYQQFRENLTAGQSQLQQARIIIGTEILLENRPITQGEIENATYLARSLISDCLKLLLDWKMIQLIKKPGDRKKYYVINYSWDSRLINRLRVSKRYAIDAKIKIGVLLEKTKQLKKNVESLSLQAFFEHIHYSYIQFEKYFDLLEVIYLKKRLNEIKTIT